MSKENKKPVEALKNISWIKCSKYCLAVECFGVSECENICPEKFKRKSIMIDKKELKRKIRLLRKFKKDTRMGTPDRRTINKQIRELKTQINNVYNCDDPTKKPLIDKINEIYPHLSDLRKFTVEQLQYHYDKITGRK